MLKALINARVHRVFGNVLDLSFYNIFVRRVGILWRNKQQHGQICKKFLEATMHIQDKFQDFPLFTYSFMKLNDFIQ